MKANYDSRTDTLRLVLREGSTVAESDEAEPGFVFDYDDDGNVLAIEVLDASRRITEPESLEYDRAG
jgi:uncharacterized protein YuzE